MSDIQITRLRYPDTIRKNVGMYLSGTESYTVPLREIANNSEDELLNGYATFIHIFNYNDFKMVVDNGRGIPIYADPETPDISILKSTVTDVHAGSKLEQSDEVTSGTHGVGSSAVNAVSEQFTVIRRINEKDLGRLPENWGEVTSGMIYVLSYNKGLLTYEEVLADLDDVPEFVVPTAHLEKLSREFSTAVYFKPDLGIYQSAAADVDLLPLKICLKDRPNCSIVVNGETLSPFDFRRDISGEETALFMDQTIKFQFKFNDRMTIDGEIGFRKDELRYTPHNMVNLVFNENGGIHERMIIKSLGAALSQENPIVKVGDVKLGLVTFVNIFTSYRTSFNSQTKDKLIDLGDKWPDWVTKAKEMGLSDNDINDYDQYYKFYFNENECIRQLSSFFTIIIRKNKEFFSNLIARIIEYKASLNKLSNMDFVKSKLVMGSDDRKSALQGDMAKVYEATSRTYPKRELYITEGTSASSGIIKYRDTEFQSVIPLRGKMRNSASMEMVDFVDNAELLGLINTIGCGIGHMVDVSLSRYGKIIISTDLDVDGSHISNLITSVFLVHAPEVIKAGMLFKLIAPFYVVEEGKNTKFYYADQKDQIDFEKHKVHRRKGLGSYLPEETKKFIVGPTRRLVQLTYPENELVVEEARKLLYSSLARRQLMIDSGLFQGV